MAEVAQLVERRVVVPNVAGSIPVLRPKSNRDVSPNAKCIRADISVLL
jgi:hypothetical protein